MATYLTLLLGFGLIAATYAGVEQLFQMSDNRGLFISSQPYGCYCGCGGEGKPVDAIDWCCFFHQCCYREIIENGVCKRSPHDRPYKYTNHSGTIICDDDLKSCAGRICDCDIEFTDCLQDYRDVYKQNHFLYRLISPGRCRGESPECSSFYLTPAPPPDPFV